MAGHESADAFFAHHLTHLTVGSGFWTWHLDTLGMSALLAGIVGFLFWVAGRGVRTDRAPTGLTGFAEHIYDWVDRQVNDSYQQKDRRFMDSLALALFCWIVCMNAMDVVPVDLPSGLAGLAGAHFWRVLPTADVNSTGAMALVVIAFVIIAGIRAKGLGGFLHEWIAAPLGGNPLLWLPNLLMNLIELVSRPVSLALRLFGNMFAGELLFLLIAVLTLSGSEGTLTKIGLFVGQVVLGAAWSAFDVLIILLQAYIFMILPIVYISMAEEGHG
jgi:F-type H+-transporting ATPase subunit a